MRRSWPCVVVMLGPIALGCSGGGESVPIVEPPPSSCPPGEWQREDGSCVPAGLPPDMPCPPGEWLRDEDAACVPAGVPPDSCGEGFVHDGDRGCEPILPPAPCAPGLIAVPGETTCREVAPCGPHKWGDIPIEANTEFVDGSYAGGDSDGSALKPWTSIQEGVDQALPGAIVAIAAGSYLEDVMVSLTAVRLWGVCPARVAVVGTGAEIAAVQVFTGADGTELRSLAIRGSADGVASSGSLDVLLERVWVHDNAGRGVNVQNDLGRTSIAVRASLLEQNPELGVFLAGSEATVEASVIRATRRGFSVQAHPTTGVASTLLLRRSLVEQTEGTGVHVAGSEATVEASVVRDTQPDALGRYGYGVAAQPASMTAVPSTLLLRSSLVEQSHEIGVLILASQATIEASVVRDTQLDSQGITGPGVKAQADPMTGAASTLLLRTSLVEESHAHGVFILASQATIEASVVRDTQLDAEGISGRGVEVLANPMTGAASTLVVRSSLIERNQELGVFVEASEATLEASIVRDTLPNAHGLDGRGVNVQAAPTTGVPSKLLLVTSLVERNHVVGVFLGASEGTLEASVVRDTTGRGLSVQAYPITGSPSSLVLRRSLVEHSQESGVIVHDSAATLDASVIRGTAAQQVDGRYGDGVSVVNSLGLATATLDNVRIEESARGALAVYGAPLRYRNTQLRCQSIDLIAEAFEGRAYVVENLGGNQCGCPVVDGECILESAGFEPPKQVAPAPSPNP